MKKLITGIAIILAMTMGAQAQDTTQSKFGRDKPRMEDRYKELNLTDAQKAEVKTINASFREKMDNLKKETSLGEKEMKDKKKAISMEHRSAFENVLTAEQKTKFAEMRKERKEKGGHRKGGNS